jgi:hypothetical protein
VRLVCTLLAYTGLLSWLVLPASILWSRRLVTRARAEADAIRDRAGGHVEAALATEADSATRAVEILLAASAAGRATTTRADPDR